MTPIIGIFRILQMGLRPNSCITNYLPSLLYSKIIIGEWECAILLFPSLEPSSPLHLCVYRDYILHVFVNLTMLYLIVVASFQI